MKTKLMLLLLVGSMSICSFAQTASVEKTTYGLQTGLLGVWFHRESKLTNQIALRAEFGLNAGFQIRGSQANTQYFLVPVITAEPRWYYNLNKRKLKSRNIAGNSGNFLSLQTSFMPNWFVISNYDNAETYNFVRVIPTWGIKRNIGKHFTYETGIGIGYGHLFREKYGDLEGVAVNLHLRLGYRF